MTIQGINQSIKKELLTYNFYRFKKEYSHLTTTNHSNNNKKDDDNNNSYQHDGETQKRV
jgi:hypothetical protein